MKLYNYLKEDPITIGDPIGNRTYTTFEVDEFQHHWKKISKECKPFIESLRRQKTYPNLLIRGSKDSMNSFSKNSVRKNRRPKDTPQRYHEAFDNAFKSQHGWYARSQSLFVTGNQSTARSYGEVYVILPVGRFDYLWSPNITDLFSDVVEDNAAFKHYKDEITNELEDQWEEEYNDEDSENGIWWYEGQSTRKSNKEDAIDYVINFIENPDEDDEDYDEDDIMSSIEKSLEWEPEISKDAFVATRIEHYELSDDQIERYCEQEVRRAKYINSNLQKYFSGYRDHELMLKCDHYYAIRGSWDALVSHFIYKDDDPRQLSIFEGRK